jgi:hypothetical protein
MAVFAPLLLASVPGMRAVSCDACSEQERVNAVSAVARSPGESQVYVIDVAAATIRLYNVWIDSEPGLYHVTVDEIEVPASARESFAEVLRRLPPLRKV